MKRKYTKENTAVITIEGGIEDFHVKPDGVEDVRMIPADIHLIVVDEDNFSMSAEDALDYDKDELIFLAELDFNIEQWIEDCERCIDQYAKDYPKFDTQKWLAEAKEAIKIAKEAGNA